MEIADDDTVLDAFESLPIHHWRYREGYDQARHLGPTAQDFNSTFGFEGAEEGFIKHIDAHGVAFAGIRALRHRVADQAATIAALVTRVEAMERGTRV